MKSSCIIEQNRTEQNRTEQNRTEQNSLRALLRRSSLLHKCVHSIRVIRNYFRYSKFWKPYNEMFASKVCLEIGGPSALFSPIYLKCKFCDGVNFSANTVWWKKGSSEKYTYSFLTLGDLYIADAVKIDCLHDASYDFVMSSNNLEHIANPIKALKEMTRVLKSGGSIVILVPDKQYTFDHRREYTSFEHMLEDYENDTPETDLTHLPEILELHDLSMDLPAGDIENFRKRSELNYENRCLHQHVFSEDSLKRIFEYLGIEVINCCKCFQNYMIAGKKV